VSIFFRSMTPNMLMEPLILETERYSEQPVHRSWHPALAIAAAAMFLTLAPLAAGFTHLAMTSGGVQVSRPPLSSAMRTPANPTARTQWPAAGPDTSVRLSPLREAPATQWWGSVPLLGAGVASAAMALWSWFRRRPTAAEGEDAPLVVVVLAAAAEKSPPRMDRKPTPSTDAASGRPDLDTTTVDDVLDKVGRTLNDTLYQALPEAAREVLQVQPAGASQRGPIAFLGQFSKLLATPETPGLPRPAWLVALGSIPTKFVWYNYYKFLVEEELYQEELRKDGRVKGFGGLGTMIPYVSLNALGFGLSDVLHLPSGETLFTVAGVWFAATQFNLYRRVNSICAAPDTPPPLFAWWAVLPPPFNLVVGLRQAHFLAKKQTAARGEVWEGDAFAEEWFPFISVPSLTLRKFLRTPSLWAKPLKDVPDFDVPFLQDPPSSFT